MAIPKHAIKKINTCSESTSTTYYAVLRRILAVTSWKKLATPTKATIKKIEDEISNPNSRSVLYSSLLKCVGKSACRKYKLLLDECRKSIESKYDQQEPTISVDRNQKLEMTENAIKSFYALPSKLKATKALIFSLVFKRPPRRLDIADLKYANYDIETDNYYNGKDGVFVFNKYKTVKTYGRQTIELTPDEKTFADYLSLASSTDKLFTFGRSGLGKFLNRHVGFSTNVCRQSYVSSELHSSTPNLVNMKNTANAMGHSVNAQVSYYMKK